MTNGSGPVISVNSWGYTSSPGMAGPTLYDSSASCLFGEAIGGEVDWTRFTRLRMLGLDEIALTKRHRDFVTIPQRYPKLAKARW